MFTITIDTDNAAFSHDGEEVARVLESVAESIRYGLDSDSVRDSNGNTVGKWTIDEAGRSAVI